MRVKNRFYFKACPRCRGDMYLDQDMYGVYGKCLQCGRIYDIPANVAKVEPVETHRLAA